MALKLFTEELKSDTLPSLTELNKQRELWLSENMEVLRDAWLVAIRLGLNVEMPGGRFVRVAVFDDFMVIAGQSDKGYMPDRGETATLDWVRVCTKEYPREQWTKNRGIASMNWSNRASELHPDRYFCVPGTWCEEVTDIGNTIRLSEADAAQVKLDLQKQNLAQTLWLIDK